MQGMSGWIYKLTRWILGGVFIYAGSTKLMEPRVFTVLIEAYGFVPESLLMPVAIGLPFLEVIAGFGLFGGCIHLRRQHQIDGAQNF